MVLGFGGQPIKDFRGRGPLVGLKLAALTHVHQSVRLFRARRHNTAWAVILERTAHHHLVIGQKR